MTRRLTDNEIAVRIVPTICVGRKLAQASFGGDYINASNSSSSSREPSTTTVLRSSKNESLAVMRSRGTVLRSAKRR